MCQRKLVERSSLAGAVAARWLMIVGAGRSRISRRDVPTQSLINRLRLKLIASIGCGQFEDEQRYALARK